MTCGLRCSLQPCVEIRCRGGRFVRILEWLFLAVFLVVKQSMSRCVLEDESTSERANAGDKQSKFIPIFLDCPDFTTDAWFDFTEDALRDALRFIEITATISALTLTTPSSLTWRRVAGTAASC